jgi:predicted nucleic acid-binding protein
LIVVDTNIISHFYLNSEFSESADALYQKDPDWVVPLLWRSEFRSILAYHLKRDMLDAREALVSVCVEAFSVRLAF